MEEQKNGTEVAKVILDLATNKKYRGYMLTINNPSLDVYTALQNDDYQYCVYQVEKGACGTMHIQAFIYYRNPRVWPKKKYPTAHIEPSRNINDCIKYCTKEETRVTGPYEFGEKPKQGQRSDLEDTVSTLRNEGISGVTEKHPIEFIKFHSGLGKLWNTYMPPRKANNPWRVFWFWGPSGTEKTKTAFMTHENEGQSVYIKDGTQWWDGYHQQTAIIIDDFDGRWPYRDFLRLLDRYPYQGQVKNSYININSDILYITCEHPPEYFWGDNELEQVNRRLTGTLRFPLDEPIPEYISVINNMIASNH